MNTKITLLLFICCFCGFAQKDSTLIFEINYTRILHPPNRASSLTSYYSTKMLPKLGLSIHNKQINKSESSGLVNDPDHDTQFYFTPKDLNISVVFKNYNNNELYSKESIGSKQFVLKDSLTIFNWQMHQETKQISNYNCQKATTLFRGRHYTAWFTTELPMGGPWKYDGLPGLILEIKSDDSFISFEAHSFISKMILPNNLTNPFLNDNDQVLSWNKFKALYKEKAIALSKYSTESGNNNRIISSRMGIERYIEENDLDYTADKAFELERNQKN